MGINRKKRTTKKERKPVATKLPAIELIRQPGNIILSECPQCGKQKFSLLWAFTKQSNMTYAQCHHCGAGRKVSLDEALKGARRYRKIGGKGSGETSLQASPRKPSKPGQGLRSGTGAMPVKPITFRVPAALSTWRRCSMSWTEITRLTFVTCCTTSCSAGKLIGAGTPGSSGNTSPSSYRSRDLRGLARETLASQGHLCGSVIPRRRVFEGLST